ncbi:MAG: hypothetical protein IT285_03100 [Bdellovibrionales bacterium]|nr:hypothetical protein [Bdellovibrionales bacterium]
MRAGILGLLALLLIVPSARAASFAECSALNEWTVGERYRLLGPKESNTKTPSCTATRSTVGGAKEFSPLGESGCRAIAKVIRARCKELGETAIPDSRWNDTPVLSDTAPQARLRSNNYSWMADFSPLRTCESSGKKCENRSEDAASELARVIATEINRALDAAKR